MKYLEKNEQGNKMEKLIEIEDTCPQRQKYTLSEIWDKYKECKNLEYFRYELERKGLSEIELLDLIEMLSIFEKR